jgi:hypothetical protein
MVGQMISNHSIVEKLSNAYNAEDITPNDLSF